MFNAEGIATATRFVQINSSCRENDRIIDKGKDPNGL